MSTHIVAYLNRQTGDGRVLTHLTIDEGPWPVLHHGDVIGRIVRASVQTEYLTALPGGPHMLEVVKVECSWDGDEPDWSDWCLSAVVKDAGVHVIAGARMKMFGTFGGAALTPVDDWPWASLPSSPARSLRERRLAAVRDAIEGIPIDHPDLLNVVTRFAVNAVEDVDARMTMSPRVGQ